MLVTRLLSVYVPALACAPGYGHTLMSPSKRKQHGKMAKSHSRSSRVWLRETRAGLSAIRVRTLGAIAFNLSKYFAYHCTLKELTCIVFRCHLITYT